MAFSVLDIIFLVLIGIAAIRGAFRGFVTEFLSAAAIILGIIAAVFFSKAAGRIVATQLGLTNWSEIIAFLIIFLAVYIIIKIFEGALNNFVDTLKLGGLDKALGFFLGILEGVLLAAVIVFLLTVQPLFDVTGIVEESFIALLILNILPYGMAFIKEKI